MARDRAVGWFIYGRVVITQAYFVWSDGDDLQDCFEGVGDGGTISFTFGRSHSLMAVGGLLLDGRWSEGGFATVAGHLPLSRRERQLEEALLVPGSSDHCI